MTAYEVQADYQSWDFVSFPNGFSSDVADALFYGDLDAEAGAVRRRYARFEDGLLQPLYTSDLRSGRERVDGRTFFLPGRVQDRYRKREGTALRVMGDADTKIGAHRISFGAEYEQQTRRAFELIASHLASYYDDDFVEFSGGVTRYEDLPESAFPFGDFTGVINRYGYDVRGIDTVDDEDIDAYFNVIDRETGQRENSNVAPYKPIYYAGYIQDRLAWNGFSFDLGLRVEAFDNNTLVLKDVYANVPILRGDFAGLTDPESAFFQGMGFTLPAGIDSDYAVYFDDSNVVRGYRDLDGNFYSVSGQSVRRDDVLNLGAQVVRDEMEERGAAFEDASVHVVVQPRVRVSLDATKSVRLFMHYARQARRPPPSLYTPFALYEEASSSTASRLGGAGLGPEVLDAFGIGAAFAVSDRLGMTASLFYDRYHDLPVSRPLSGGFPDFTALLNEGLLTHYGLSTHLRLDRSREVAIDANYTLAFGSSTVPYAGVRIVQDDVSSGPSAPADFDVRHALRVVLDYRMPQQRGWLGGLGAGLIASAQSGRPYTAIAELSDVASPFTLPVGKTNGSRRPGLRQLDVWVDKAFEVRGAQLTAFLWVENVLGMGNPLAVYRATGEADTGGYLETSEGQSYLQTAPVPAASAFNYAAYTSGPANVRGVQTTGGPWTYGRPRQVRIGLRLRL